MENNELNPQVENVQEEAQAAVQETAAEEKALKKANKVINKLNECGIRNIQITGGEPLAHPKFKEEFTTNNIMGVYFPYMLHLRRRGSRHVAAPPKRPPSPLPGAKCR